MNAPASGCRNPTAFTRRDRSGYQPSPAARSVVAQLPDGTVLVAICEQHEVAATTHSVDEKLAHERPVNERL